MKSWELTKKKTDAAAVLRGDWHAGWMEVAAPLQQISTTTDGFPRRRSRSESPPPFPELIWSSTIKRMRRNKSPPTPPHTQHNARENHQPFFFCSCLIGSRSTSCSRAVLLKAVSSSNTYHQKSDKEQKPPHAEENRLPSSFFTDPMYRKSDKQTEHLLYSKRCF